MKYKFSLFLLVFGVLFSYAQNRTEQQMRRAAINVQNANSTNTSRAPQQAPLLKKMKQMPKLAIYGYEGGSFAVIASDDRFAEVIGYSDTEYSESEMPCGFKWWLEAVNKSMESASDSQTTSSFSRVRRAATKASVPPLMTTKWGQDTPYNDLCVHNGKRMSTGCVATAIAQVMKYHNYPERGKGSYSYRVNYSDWGEVTYYSNFANHEYEWSRMLDNYSSGGYSDAQAKAVATLMYDCGVSVNMIYTTDVSSSTAYFGSISLPKYFSYSDATRYLTRSTYAKDDWMAIVYSELSEGRPIVYGGSRSNASVGHAFVLHGYDSSGNVYVNWGWNGNYDGYYNIDLLDPYGADGYSEDQDMLIIVPGEYKSAYSLTYIVDDETYKTYTVNVGETITPEPAPTKDGFSFSGWSEIPEKMPKYNVIVTGSFVSSQNLAGHEFVDLGLPSGKVWAKTNYGSMSETGYGQYCYWSGTNDVVANSWGNLWKTPSRSDFLELINYCTWTWETVDGVNGYKVRGNNGNSIFLPAAGFQIFNTGQSVGSQLYYWTSDRYDDEFSFVLFGSSTNYHSNSTYNTSLLTCPIRPVSKNKYEHQTYKITYLVDGHEYKSFTKKVGDTITPETEPTKEGYTFSGWSYIPSTMPARDVAITGTFTVNKYKLIYKVDDVEYKTLSVEYGSTITTETALTKDGYTFSGWSEIPKTMPAHDVTVTGTFTVNSYTLTYMVDGQVFKIVSVKYGSTITAEAAPTKEGYTFSGWSEIPRTMPAHDVTVTGEFSIIIDEPVLKDNVIGAKDVIAFVGSKITLPIVMNNTENIIGIQFDLTLPDGVSVVTDEDDGYKFTLTNRATSSHKVTAKKRSNDSYRVLVMSLQNSKFKGNEGTVIEATLAITKNMAVGEYSIMLSDIEMSTAQNKAIRPDAFVSKLIVQDIMPGDANGDGTVDISDYIGVANHILGIPQTGFNADAADVNKDGIIDISDYIGVANIILTGKP